MTDDAGLRAALDNAIREKEAVKEMFAKDTGADIVKIDTNGYGTTVELEFLPEDASELEDLDVPSGGL